MTTPDRGFATVDPPTELATAGAAARSSSVFARPGRSRLPAWTRVSVQALAGGDRRESEDAHLADARANLFVVCDGVRTRDRGELASRLAVDTIEQQLRQSGWLNVPDAPLIHLADALTRAFLAANQRLLDESGRLRLGRGLGSTVVAAVVLRDFAVIASVGDSRAYLRNARGARRLTRDHTVAEQCADMGLIGAATVARHPMRHVLARFLGNPAGAEPDIVIVPVAPGDRLLLSTDGLQASGVEEQVLELAGLPGPLDEVTARMAEVARGEQRRHDLTLVLVECQREGEEGGLLARSAVATCEVGAAT